MTRFHLQLLTHSSVTMFRRCPREYQHAYVTRRRPRAKADALRFGTFFHAGLNAWWRVSEFPIRATPERRMFAALGAVREAATSESDAFERVKAEELLLGYTARWCDEGYRTIDVERRFRIELDEHFDLGGSIDAIAEGGGNVHLVEHKTTSSDISPGSDYWRRVYAMDPQVSTYMLAATELGINPRDCIYDAVRKVDLKPFKATPVEDRKYTKATKTAPSRLYAGQHEQDETADEYRLRVRAHIELNPNRYFQRMPIVRLPEEHVNHKSDLEAAARMVHEAMVADSFPRSTNACERWGRLCDYFDACSGLTSIDDESRFETKTAMHEELS